MSDALRSAFETAGFIAPDYGGQCLDGVLPAAAAALGAGDEADTAAQARLGVPHASRVVVVLVDGLGHHILTERSTEAPFLARQLAAGRVLTTGFPSTTATAMGVFGTGAGAGRTGMAGYTVRNPHTGGLANLVSWEGLGPAREWQPVRPVFDRLSAAGVEVTSVGPGRFQGSGLTEAALRGARFVGAERLEDRVDAALFELGAPGLVYLYWGEVDKVGHQEGWRSKAYGAELSATDRELARLARSLPRDTVMLVTADHGMVDVDLASFVDVARTPALSAGVEMVAGEPRAMHVHVRPGQAEAVHGRWVDVLEGRAVVARRDEAIALGWFGPVSPEVRPVVGDVVVAATGRAGIVDSRVQSPRSMRLRGMHGSFTPAEMQIPFLVAD